MTKFFFFSSPKLTSQTQKHTRAFVSLFALTTGNISNVGVGGQRGGNLFAGINATDFNQTSTGLGNSFADDIGTLGFTFCADNVGLTLLLSALDDKAGSLGILLGNLFLLNGAGEFLAESHVSDGYILEGDVELFSAAHEIGADAVRHGLSLGDELGGVELGDDGLEDFVSDGGEHTFIVISTVRLFLYISKVTGKKTGGKPYLVDLGQVRDLGTVQHTQRQADHLQILGAGRRGDIPGLGSHVVDDAPLQPGNQEMRSLADHLFLHTSQAVEDDGARAALDVVNRGINSESTGDGQGEPSEESVWRRHYCDER